MSRQKPKMNGKNKRKRNQEYMKNIHQIDQK